jgi:hypothetical protein
MPHTTLFKDYINAMVATPSTAPTLGATRWIGFFIAGPTIAGGGTEASGGAYARVQLLSASMGSPTGTNTRTIANTVAIAFNEASANWGNITHIGIFDASTAGNLLSFYDSTDFTANAGITPNIPIGTLTVTQGETA